MLQMKTITDHLCCYLDQKTSLKLNTQATSPHSTSYICMLATMPITDTIIRSVSNCDITELLKTKPILCSALLGELFLSHVSPNLDTNAKTAFGHVNCEYSTGPTKPKSASLATKCFLQK